MQWGFANVGGGAGRGVQLGFFNQSDNYRGLQMGFSNVTDSLRGVQIGLINVILDDVPPPPFIPLINVGF